MDRFRVDICSEEKERLDAIHCGGASFECQDSHGLTGRDSSREQDRTFHDELLSRLLAHAMSI